MNSANKGAEIMTTAADIAAIARGVEMPEGVTMNFSGRMIRVYCETNRKVGKALATERVRKAKGALVKALLAAETGRKLRHAKVRGYQVWCVSYGSGLSFGLGGMAAGVEIELTEEEHRNVLLGCPVW